ncbi:TPA: glycosyltransferase family 2 protein [Candidatus Woesearchaeota archaeon]|nr:glycosyltransferase family 2 protein [Candidatus Woesearchaeota archaeon]
MTAKTFIVIPAHNERKYIAGVIKRTKKFCKNIIVVDDGSTDNTFEVAKKEGIVVLKHIVNLGKGAALKTGCEYALKKGAGIIVVMDADGQHRPEDIPRFLKALQGNDIIFGARSLDKTMPSILKFGNWFINRTNQVLFDVSLMDTQSGYRAFTAEAYRKIKWDAQDYSVESEMIANAGNKGLKYSEIKIKTIYTDRYKGTTILDGIKIVITMLWWRVTKWH